MVDVLHILQDDAVAHLLCAVVVPPRPQSETDAGQDHVVGLHDGYQPFCGEHHRGRCHDALSGLGQKDLGVLVTQPAEPEDRIAAQRVGLGLPAALSGDRVSLDIQHG